MWRKLAELYRWLNAPLAPVYHKNFLLTRPPVNITLVGVTSTCRQGNVSSRFGPVQRHTKTKWFQQLIPKYLLFQQRRQAAVGFERVSEVSFDRFSRWFVVYWLDTDSFRVFIVNCIAVRASIRREGAARATLPMTCTRMLPSRKTFTTSTIRYSGCFY